MKFQGTGKTDAKEKLAKSLVSLISSITGSKGGATIVSTSTDVVMDAIMEQAMVAAGKLKEISKGGYRHGRSHKSNLVLLTTMPQRNVGN